MAPAAVTVAGSASNYCRYRRAAANDLAAYPLDQAVDPALYRPIAPWLGRLILPEPAHRRADRGVLLEVHHAPPAYRHLVGQLALHPPRVLAQPGRP